MASAGDLPEGVKIGFHRQKNNRKNNHFLVNTVDEIYLKVYSHSNFNKDKTYLDVGGFCHSNSNGVQTPSLNTIN